MNLRPGFLKVVSVDSCRGSSRSSFEANSNQRDPEPADIGEHSSVVREKREALRDASPHDLGDEVGAVSLNTKSRRR